MCGAIGIIGGVGPYAGLDLNKKIFDNMQTNGTDQDYLDVYLISRSSDITDRTKYLKHEEAKNPAEGLFRSILKLEDAGATVMGIPCNTAHSMSIYNRVKELMALAGCQGKLLHIVEETHKYLEENHSSIKKIGLLGTLGTYETKLYENYFNEKEVFELMTPNEEGKNRCHNAIYDLEYGVKAYSSPVTQKAKDAFIAEIESFEKKGVEAVILGCTEIPLAFENMDKLGNVILIDPTDILARALIKNVDETHLKAK
ncbi:amino acid racemase [Malaciobacter mytili]|uniref:aspartate/glutamate racemase family protein n=1 Tax=Malaciobacter mytili TaxID=603050 RepID=UPI003BB053C6